MKLDSRRSYRQDYLGPYFRITVPYPPSGYFHDSGASLRRRTSTTLMYKTPCYYKMYSGNFFLKIIQFVMSTRRLIDGEKDPKMNTYGGALVQTSHR